MHKPLLALFLPFLLTACLGDNETTSKREDTQVAPQLAADKKELPSTTPLDKSDKTLMQAEESPLATIKGTKEKLSEITANLQCDTTSQCKVQAVGSRACGGPSRYIVYSTKHTNSDDVTKHADTITQYEKTLNAKEDMASICQHIPAPGTQCISNSCVKIEGSSASPY
ncbi:hypothetical protein [Pseudoalteromonas sp. MMG010]|uniref:hypothetical protein n=1 Tax=Pseudoalteromonas sp. MMG010 TaxID=2822685 RepID=UPI001FFCBFFB|nr:hypothetical protein [Pseudoalteromonas sp. MMG010]